MKKFFFICLLLGGMFVVPSCDLTETNVDPNKIAEVELRQLLPSAMSQSAKNQLGFPMRISAVIMQQFNSFDGPLNYQNYGLPAYFFNNFWNEGLYSGSLKDCQVIIEQAQAEGQAQYEGIAKVLMAKELGNATLMFGDVPYSDAFQGLESLNPAFDTQEEIMAGIFQLLDEAINLLEQTPTAGGPSADDLIFGGDMQAWIQTAWALKARFHMQMSRRDANAAPQTLAALEKSFQAIDQQPNFQWGTGLNESNPLYRFSKERANTLILHNNFVKLLANDPRLSVIGRQINSNSEWRFEYQDSLYWARETCGTPLISYVELAFIKAEALWQTSASEASLQEAFAGAVTASMQQVGLEADAYEAFIEALPNLSNLSREEQLEAIITESYIALYGHEHTISWANYRRTGFPKLTPSPYGSNSLNPSGGIPKRFLIPENEELANPANVAAAKERQQGGLMDVPLWIFE